jgi:hypothetical protein
MMVREKGKQINKSGFFSIKKLFRSNDRDDIGEWEDREDSFCISGYQITWWLICKLQI